MYTLSINIRLKANQNVNHGRTQHISRNEGDMAYEASFQICYISYTSFVNTIFEKTRSHKGSDLVILLAKQSGKYTR